MYSVIEEWLGIFLQVQRCDLPWITKNIVRHMQKRNSLLRKSTQQASGTMGEVQKIEKQSNNEVTVS